MRYILTDIEGTTTSVSFVYDTLFPYFKREIAGFIHQFHARADVALLLDAIQYTVLEEGGKMLASNELAQQLIAWTDADRKHPGLKTMQGLVWRLAYQKGELKGHLYPDVLPALERWRQAGIRLGVYSSGSVEAQTLLFGHSEFGDLTPYFSNYFDTQVGHKREVQSYRIISNILDLPPQDILFLSDVDAELDAAAEMGMQTIQLVRPGTAPGHHHRTAVDFTEI